MALLIGYFFTIIFFFCIFRLFRLTSTATFHPQSHTRPTHVQRSSMSPGFEELTTRFELSKWPLCSCQSSSTKTFFPTVPFRVPTSTPLLHNVTFKARDAWLHAQLTAKWASNTSEQKTKNARTTGRLSKRLDYSIYTGFRRLRDEIES